MVNAFDDIIKRQIIFSRCSQNRIKNYFNELNRKFPNDLSMFFFEILLESEVNYSQKLCIETMKYMNYVKSEITIYICIERSF